MNLDNEQPLISVIVPVYNVERYLEQCMENLIMQTYKNYEIILVNDGSTDGSGILCRQYEEKYNNIMVVEQQNGGLSDARNNGVKAAKGEYICFVDSDDYVTKDMLEKLIFALLEYNADISAVKCKEVGAAFAPLQNDTSYKDKIHVFGTEQALENMCYGKYYGVTACAKLYKKEFVVRHPYPVGMLYEDLATTYRIIGDCTRLAVVDSVGYFYMKRAGSITQSGLDKKHVGDGMRAAREELEYVEKNFPNIVNAAVSRCAQNIFLYMNVLKLFSKEDKKWYYFFKKALKPYGKVILKDKKAKLNIKIRICAVRMGYVPTCAVWKGIRLLKKML